MKNNRYIKQEKLRDFGPEAQQRLKDASVLVVGLGGLGIPVLQYLNAMGVGRLGLVDQDQVDLSNLQRQVLYDEADIGAAKLDVCAEKLRRQNSDTIIDRHDAYLSRNNALEVIAPYDLVIDASDNFPTRYLINDACVILNKAFIYGALHGFEGQVSVFNFQDGPTYRCLFPEIPGATEVPSCDENGVLGVLPGIIGNFQALEAVKVITGKGSVLAGQLLIYNGLNPVIHKITFTLKPENTEIKALQESYQVPSCASEEDINADELASLLNSGRSCTIIDVRSDEEYQEDHLMDVMHIPLDKLATKPLKLTSDEEVYLICQSGVRSLQAKYLLQRQYPKISFFNVRGGLNSIRSGKVTI
ncbi:MAG: HesA/MoeB/ThiF family protein [Eudoraea sp.]|nr:HesA/MoeB/ThiF family protein [Eudoraea sp.]